MADFTNVTADRIAAGSEEALADLLAQLGAAQARPGNDLAHLPKRLSPSRASDFATCPQVFYYKTICGLREPGSIATTRGSLSHAAFERIFDHPAGERTEEVAISYIAPAWAEMLDPPVTAEAPEGSDKRAALLTSAAEYRKLAPAGSQEEADLLESAAQMVRNWFQMERVNNFSPNELEMPDGSIVDGRELHVGAALFGVYLHGFIDRLDRWVAPNGDVVWSISDYKTGKIPGEGKTYSQRTMDRIAYEAFFQLRVYAVLAWEVYKIPVRHLRLIYVKTADREAGIKTMTVDQRIIESTRAEVRASWNQILRSTRDGVWQTKVGPLCNWCYFADLCPAQGNRLPVAEIVERAG